jgi:shikimate kinase
LPIIAIDPENFCNKAALEALEPGACNCGRSENPAYLAKLIEQQLQISETWTTISSYQVQVSELETQANAEFRMSEAPIA